MVSHVVQFFVLFITYFFLNILYCLYIYDNFFWLIIIIFLTSHIITNCDYVIRVLFIMRGGAVPSFDIHAANYFQWRVRSRAHGVRALRFLQLPCLMALQRR